MAKKTALPPEVELLKAEYIKAQSQIINKIQSTKMTGSQQKYLQALLTNINMEVKAINDFSVIWANSYIPKNYNNQMNKILKKARELNVFPKEAVGHKEAIDLLVRNMTGNLLSATDYLGRQVNDIVREVGVESITQKLIQGQTLNETKNSIIGKLLDKGLTAVVDKRGRKISLPSYAEVVARSTYAETVNIATTNTMLELGSDLVQMSAHRGSCELCMPYQGRVYSITGKTKGYPKLDVPFKDGYSNIHPNCIHTLTPYFADLDKNPAKTRFESNRPYKITSEQQKEVDAYKAVQKEKAKLNADKKEWQDMKLALGDDAPKTLAGYRKAKAAGTDEFKAKRKQVLDKKKAEAGG